MSGEGRKMIMEIYAGRTGFTDLNAVSAGAQVCPPAHAYGPAVREY